MLELKPITLKIANEFVSKYHRHNKETQGHKFSIGLTSDEKLIGVVICGRPVARLLDDGWTAEITRCCTDGTKNGCTKLYGAAYRAAMAMGYKKVITYTLESELGTSLKASGFRFLRSAGGSSWNREKRPRSDKAPLCGKHLWMKSIGVPVG